MLAYQVKQTAGNLLSMNDLDNAEIDTLLNRAEEFKHGVRPHFSEPVYAVNLFFENSTRTHTSFEMAERKLGLTILPFDPSTSSVTKGETLHDTLLTLNAIGAQIAVIRHSQNHYYDALVSGGDLDLGIVNAGDGSGEHPSQSLLDLMTIREEFGAFAGLRVLICGDISHSRVARSNAEALGKLGATVLFAGPQEWFDGSLSALGEYGDWDELLPTADVVMMLRVQHERGVATENFDGAAYAAQYGLTVERAGKMKSGAIVMHPGPINRGVELASELVQAPCSRFVKQMQNGVYVRMAMLERICQERHFGGMQ